MQSPANPRRGSTITPSDPVTQATERVPLSVPSMGEREAAYLRAVHRRELGGLEGPIRRRVRGAVRIDPRPRPGRVDHQRHSRPAPGVSSRLGLGPGDEVLVPALTFAASANAVLYTGATAGVRGRRSRDVHDRSRTKPPRVPFSRARGRSWSSICTGTPPTWTPIAALAGGSRPRGDRGRDRGARLSLPGPPMRHARRRRLLLVQRQQGDHRRRRRDGPGPRP